MKGMIRPGVGGEHPVLGVLVPGQVLEIPVGLWSDELFAPAKEGALPSSQPLPAVDEESIEGLGGRLRVAQDRVQTLDAAREEVRQIETEAARLQATLDSSRAVSRRLRALQARIDQWQMQSGREVAAMHHDLGVLLLEAEEAAKAFTPAP
jgi:hypothetical protein